MHWPRCLAALFVVLALAGCAMEKRARCGVLRWISSQGVWRDDLDLTMWSGNEVLKALSGTAIVHPINQSTPMPR
jgi:hypothetical protein